MIRSPIITGRDILLVCCLLVLATPATYAYSSCNSTSFLNTANLQCYSCLSNQVANSYQVVATSCQCSPGYQVATNNAACTAVFSSTCSISNSYYPIHTLNGITNTGTSNCIACSSNAYANKYMMRDIEIVQGAFLVGQE
jgi:hypothetical protein